MSKFLKRIQKSLRKDITTVIMVGHSDEYTPKIIENFPAVFYIDNSIPPPKARNIIHLRDLGFLNDLTNVDIIFLNQRFDHNVLQFITPLSKKSAPFILVHEDHIVNNEYYELFIRIKYEQITWVDKYQIWKLKRK